MDKLSEIRDLEEDESKEKETKEKERKERREQLSNLKNPKFEVRRRTIRRMLRLQASNPFERVQALAQGRPQWWKQLSLPHFRRQRSGHRGDLRKTVSSPEGSSSHEFLEEEEEEKLSVITEEEGVEGGEGLPRSHSSNEGTGAGKRQNPLSLMRNPTDYFELESMSTGFMAQTASATRMGRVHRNRSSSPPPVLMAGEDEGFVFDPERRQMSIASTPGTVGRREGEGREQVVVPPRRARSLTVGAGSNGSFEPRVNQ